MGVPLAVQMGGDIKKIRDVGEYMIEVWKAAGMDMTNVEVLHFGCSFTLLLVVLCSNAEADCLSLTFDFSRFAFQFIWCSDTINANSNEYWLQVMDIATRFSLTRMKRCGAIMGRKVRLGVLAVYACLVCVVLSIDCVCCCPPPILPSGVRRPGCLPDHVPCHAVCRCLLPQGGSKSHFHMSLVCPYS